MSLIPTIFRKKTPNRIAIEVILDVLDSSPARMNKALAAHILAALKDAEVKL